MLTSKSLTFKINTNKIPLSQDKINYIDSTFCNFRSETSGSVISIKQFVSIYMEKTYFWNCSSLNLGGAIYCTECASLTVLLSCFGECYSNKSYGAVKYLEANNETTYECSFYGCGNPSARLINYFEGDSSAISSSNFSFSTILYSIAQFVTVTTSSTMSYSTMTKCSSSWGIALHANKCEATAMFENVNVVDNADQKLAWGLIHFDGSTANLNKVMVMRNIGFTFISSETKSVTTKDCYSDCGTEFGFIIDKSRTIEENRLLTIQCINSIDVGLGVHVEVTIILSIFLNF